MGLEEWEYHPYAACMMFQAVPSNSKVRKHLREVIRWGLAHSRVVDEKANEPLLDPPTSTPSRPSDRDTLIAAGGDPDIQPAPPKD